MPLTPIHSPSTSHPPILADKAYREASVFSARNMLREARRQKSLAEHPVPSICILDPDGDIVRNQVARRRATRSATWACYHSEMYEFTHAGLSFGIVGCAVGASYAVLIAEEMFACGCELLISITSAGQIVATGPTPCFVLIERALRDEGTSYHYLPPSEFSTLDARLHTLATAACKDVPYRVHSGASWTTDAPFRETASAIERRRKQGILAVEMEAAALYAFAEACNKAVICFAHVTNQMAQIDGDFEKGADEGSADALDLIARVAHGASLQPNPSPADADADT